jgi:hypothetical protein
MSTLSKLTTFAFGAAVVLSLSAAAMARVENPYGSPADAAGIFTRDYRKGVEAAFPKYDPRQLQQTLEVIAEKYGGREDPIRLRSVEAIEDLFGLAPADRRSADNVVEQKRTYYEADPDLGTAYYYRDMETLPPMSYGTATKLKDVVAREHQALLDKMGVGKDEIFYTETFFMMLRSSTDPEAGPVEETKPVVDVISTYVLRALEGVMVEGSNIKIASKGSGMTETLSLDWSRFRYHPNLRRFDLRDRDDLVREIESRVADVVNNDEKVNVMMAVVLRPVMVDGDQTFVPSLRVGVLPDDGQAGDMFYVDLPKTTLDYDDGESEDVGQRPSKTRTGELR